MSPSPFSPPQTGEIDGAYLFDASYRPRGAWSLADRAAYGLGAQSAAFREHLLKNVGLTGSSLASSLQSHARASACSAEPRTEAVEPRTAGHNPETSIAAIRERSPLSTKTGRLCAPQRSHASGALFRFTMRCAGAVWSGVVCGGRVIVAAGHAGEECTNGDQRTSGQSHGGSAQGRGPRSSGQRC